RLGVVLTVQLLAGCPQMSLFTYQVIALRVLWQIGARGTRWKRALGSVMLGMALPAGLAAGLLLPALEFARLAGRGHPLPLAEIVWNAPFGWPQLRRLLVPGMVGNRLVTLGFLALAAAAPGVRDRWRVTSFYVVLVTLSLLLTGSEAVFGYYMELPFGRT